MLSLVFGVCLQSPTSMTQYVYSCGAILTISNNCLQQVLEDPMSEETQGRNIVQASVDAGVECFIWSTLPSSHEISGGKFVTRLYEGV